MAQQQNTGSNKDLLLIGAVVVGGVVIYNIWDSIRKSLGGLSKENAEAGVKLPVWNGSFWKQQQAAGHDTLIFSSATAEALITQLANYQGVLNDDFNAVMGVLKRCKTKSQVSFLVDKFFQKYNRDLYGFLRDGYSPVPWFGQGLSNDHLTEINTYVQSLPDYKI